MPAHNVHYTYIIKEDEIYINSIKHIPIDEFSSELCALKKELGKTNPNISYLSLDCKKCLFHSRLYRCFLKDYIYKFHRNHIFTLKSNFCMEIIPQIVSLEKKLKNKNKEVEIE